MKKFITLLLSLLLLLSIAGCKEPPHAHSYNYKGACSCGESVAMEMTTSTEYWQREASLSPTHSVEAGKTYYYFTQKQYSWFYLTAMVGESDADSLISSCKIYLADGTKLSAPTSFEELNVIIVPDEYVGNLYFEVTYAQSANNVILIASIPEI